MKIWGKEVEAKELIGMEPDELKTKLESAATKADLDAIKGEFTNGLKALQDSIQALNKTPGEGNANEPNDTNEPDDPTVRVLSDPEGFVDSRTKDLRNANDETRAAVNELAARDNPQFAGVFSQFGTELKELAKKFPAADRAKENFWGNLISQFVGVKVIRGDIKTSQYPSLMGSSTVGTAADGNTKDPNAGFAPAVAEFLKKRNIPLEKAAVIHNIMQRDGDPLTAESYKAGRA